MSDSIICEKSMTFAIRIVNLYKFLTTEKNEYVMSKNLLRCGTEIGAHAYEACQGESRKDFSTKMYVALKEATATEYWLKLLLRTEFLTPFQAESMLNDCVELKKILSSITKTLKENS